MRYVPVAVLVLGMSFPALGDEIVLVNGNLVEFRSIIDKGDKYEVVTVKGEKLSIQKVDIEKIEVRVASPITGAVVSRTKAPVQELNLLKVIDPRKDKVAGLWQFSGSALQVVHVPNKDNFCQLQVPYAPPEEYDLKIVAERAPDQVHGLYIGLVGPGKTQFTVVLDASSAKSGIFSYDGSTLDTPVQEMTATGSSLFGKGKSATIQISVRKTRIQVQVDERSIIDWKVTDWSKLSLEKFWSIPRKDVLFLGAWAEFLIRKYELVPVSGMGRLTR